MVIYVKKINSVTINVSCQSVRCRVRRARVFLFLIFVPIFLMQINNFLKILPIFLPAQIEREIFQKHHNYLILINRLHMLNIFLLLNLIVTSNSPLIYIPIQALDVS